MTLCIDETGDAKKGTTTDDVAGQYILKGCRYHNNWLLNLLIASSLNKREIGKFVRHKLS
jgi:SRSO17 transposase